LLLNLNGRGENHMTDSKDILVVDDEPRICELVELYLRKEMFAVRVCHDGAMALKLFKDIPPSLVILDIMIPKIDGLQVCREMRRMSNIPIIMLTAKGESFDKVLSLELGADDYVVKPFDPRELVARVKAVLRRTQAPIDDSQKVAYPDLFVNLSEYQVRFRGRSLEMTPREIELLYYLAVHPNQVFTRDQLLEQIWGYEFMGDSRTVDVHVKRLRHKLENYDGAWQLKTVWGVGYKFEVKKTK